LNVIFSLCASDSLPVVVAIVLGIFFILLAG
jgi:hypothetical protein